MPFSRYPRVLKKNLPHHENPYAEAGASWDEVLLLFCGFFRWLFRGFFRSSFLGHLFLRSRFFCRFLSSSHFYLLFLKIKQRKFDPATLIPLVSMYTKVQGKREGRWKVNSGVRHFMRSPFFSHWAQRPHLAQPCLAHSFFPLRRA